jgi:hypothetical protein
MKIVRLFDSFLNFLIHSLKLIYIPIPSSRKPNTITTKQPKQFNSEIMADYLIPSSETTLETLEPFETPATSENP